MANKIEFGWQDDQLLIPTVGEWSKGKYRLVAIYNRLFSTGMKNNWKRVYIDLFSGPGASKIRGTNKIIMGSPLVAASVRFPFTKYIFCDSIEDKISSLQERIEEFYPNHDCVYIEGDCNDRIKDILSEIPRPSKTSTLLCFSFIDPYALLIKFETIRRLSTRFVDYVINLPFEIDAGRNISLYEGDHSRIDYLLGDNDWREKWEIEKRKGKNIVKFLSEEFTIRMEKLHYQVPDSHITSVQAD